MPTMYLRGFSTRMKANAYVRKMKKLYWKVKVLKMGRGHYAVVYSR